MRARSGPPGPGTARRDEGAASAKPQPPSLRISRFLARAGIASRRHADDLIEQGRVRVNGRAAVLGEKVAAGIDRVTVDGRDVLAEESPVYILLNKPPGYLSTCSDPFDRRTVLSLLGGVKARVFPVGRLDLDADGLLLLTNDGDLAYLLTHPKHQLIKEYVAWVVGERDDRKIQTILSGIIVDGKRVDVDRARFLEAKPEAVGPDESVRPGTAGKPVGGKPVAWKPAAWKSVGGKPVGGKPVAWKSVGKKPVGGKPVAWKPAAWKPVGKKPVAAGRAASAPLRLLIGVYEGEKHLVKNVCRAVGYRVLRLTRTRMGRLALSDLPQGKWRYLKEEEVRALHMDARGGREGDRDAERKR